MIILYFFRGSNILINGEWKKSTILGVFLSILFCLWLYHWKSHNFVPEFLAFNPKNLFTAPFFQELLQGKGTLFKTIIDSASSRSFYYSLAYTLCVIIFGIKRILLRKTPYITLQTTTLALVQIFPLFLLPEIILPYLGNSGFFSEGLGKSFADLLFPLVSEESISREYWRAYGFILAWPLFVFNFFTNSPMYPWLIIGIFQTFIIIPIIVYRWGKGAYCGWICSCGALAETLGDNQRRKMPHGPFWNKLNMIGQVFLAYASIIMLFRTISWIYPAGFLEKIYRLLLFDLPLLNYAYFVDLLFAGVFAISLYFFLSGRIWCRFACPLSALMHIYAKFSRYRIFSDKSKCISCSICTSVCHQGIDVMNFANKGKPMEDTQCVRCSACIQQCPTGVLSFGRIVKNGEKILDKVQASPVQLKENEKL